MKWTRNFSKISQRFSLFERRIVERWTIMLPGAGCEHYKKTGGCAMCGFYKANKHYSFGLVYPSLIFKHLYRLAESEITRLRPQELYLYNGGSFFNPREIPESFIEYLFKSVKEHPTLDKVMVESRVEYINRQKIDSALKMLDGKKLLIGIGLESSDGRVRNSLINKRLSSGDFEETVKLIKEAGARVLAYVLLKPLGLNEGEALEDAWETIRYCQSLGIDEIEMSCAFIQADTPMAEAYRKGKFIPPNLWTITKIIRRAAAEGWTISIGSFSDEPPPIAIPHNDCPDDCSPLIYRLIDDYRLTGRFDFSRLPNCSCRKNDST